MTNEQKLWQRRAGIITEGEYQEATGNKELSISDKPTGQAAPGMGGIKTVQQLKMYFRDLGSGKEPLPTSGMDAMEIQQLHTYIKDFINKAQKGSIAGTARTVKRSFDTSTKNIKEEDGVLNEEANEEAKKAYKDSFEWEKMSNDWSNAITGKGPNGKDTGGMDFYKANKDTLEPLFNNFHTAKLKLSRALYDMTY